MVNSDTASRARTSRMSASRGKASSPGLESGNSGYWPAAMRLDQCYGAAAPRGAANHRVEQARPPTEAAKKSPAPEAGQSLSWGIHGGPQTKRPRRIEAVTSNRDRKVRPSVLSVRAASQPHR